MADRVAHTMVAAPTTDGTRRVTAPLVRLCAGIGGATVVACAALLTLLHFLPGSDQLDPLSKPLSDYARTVDGAWFDAAVSTLALGVLAMIVALLADRRGGWRSATILGICAAGLITLVIFQDARQHGVLTDVGWVHFAASMTAFGVMHPMSSQFPEWRHFA